MCQILELKAGASIPMNLLEITCAINKHGFGVAFIENSDIKIERSVDTNDPKVLGKLLDDLKDKKRYVHIRHATVGDVTLQNSHPFVVLEQRAHRRKKKASLILMHNGTLFGYDDEKAKGVSDTALFVERFVRPLALRCEAYGGLKSILRDEFFRKVMIDEIKKSDKILMLDKTGYTLTFNRSEGKEYPEHGFWASNEYSFNPNHSRSSISTTRGGFSAFDQRWPSPGWSTGAYSRAMREDQSVLDNLPWKETREIEAEREAWILEMETVPSIAAVVGNVVFLDRAAMRKECAAAGAFIMRRSIERQSRRM